MISATLYKRQKKSPKITAKHMPETTKIEQLEHELESIKIRNNRVEADKAWETSTTRIGTLCIITYITASTVLYLIGVKDFYLGALVPVVGFFLSTLTLPPLKKWWINKKLLEPAVQGRNKKFQ